MHYLTTKDSKQAACIAFLEDTEEMHNVSIYLQLLFNWLFFIYSILQTYSQKSFQLQLLASPKQ